MRTADAYADLLSAGRPVITTSEAAARMKTSAGNAGRRLKRMEEAGLVRRVRQGLWALDLEIEPFALAPYLTAPHPAYVSMFSALARHDMIEQIPRQVSVASLDRARRIVTTEGVFEIHHLAPEVFGGFTGRVKAGYIATPEKALFDTVYVRSASGSVAHFTELTLPPGFDPGEIDFWTGRISGRRLKTLVSRRLDEVLAGRPSPTFSS